MRVSDFSTLWTPKLDSVGGSYNEQLSRLHRLHIWWSLQGYRFLLAVAHQTCAFIAVFDTTSRSIKTKPKHLIIITKTHGWLDYFTITNIIYLFPEDSQVHQRIYYRTSVWLVLRPLPIRV